MVRSAGQVLGRTSSVAPSSTTLARSLGPFQGKKIVTFLYDNELTVVGGALNLLQAHHASNSLFDFDKSSSNCFGNKQPLFYDTLLSASGPYKQYKVVSWKTTYTIHNASTSCPITVWALPPVPQTSEIDSAAEADNFPGVKRLFLTGVSGSKNIGSITVTGHINDYCPSWRNDLNLIGGYNTDPGTPIYGGLIIHGSDGSTAPSVYVAVHHEAYTELEAIDALVS